MDKKWSYNVLRSIGKSVKISPSLQIDEVDAGTSTKDSEEIKRLIAIEPHRAFINFYTYYSFYSLKWSDVEMSIGGSYSILPLDKVFINYKNFVYFDHTPEDSSLRDFKIIDFFVDEACVGIYVGRDDLPGMHFFEFENEAYPLHVDFEGYLKLLGETKGYLYWQKVILDHLRNQETPITKEFMENMPKLFDNFEFDKFIELYERLRIDK